MTISVNSDQHNEILDIEQRIAKSILPLSDLDAPPTVGMIRQSVAQLRHHTRELEALLVQPESLKGCECAQHEAHDGKCSGVDCYCH